MTPIIVIKPGTTKPQERKDLRQAGYVVIEAESSDITTLQPTPIFNNFLARIVLESAKKIQFQEDRWRFYEHLSKSLLELEAQRQDEGTTGAYGDDDS